MSELYRAPEFREQPAVEMKTMETEFGNVAASVLAVTSSTIQYRQQQQPQLHQPLAAAATAAHSVLGPSNIHNNGNKQNHANIDQSVLSIESGNSNPLRNPCSIFLKPLINLDSNKFFPADPEGMDSDLFFEITSQE